MKRAIATPAGQPTEHVELTTAEIDTRTAEETANEAEQLANAPYARLEEIDAELSTKLVRMLEDIKGNRPFHASVQTLLDEKAAIRAGIDNAT